MPLAGAGRSPQTIAVRRTKPRHKQPRGLRLIATRQSSPTGVSNPKQKQTKGLRTPPPGGHTLTAAPNSESKTEVLCQNRVKGQCPLQAQGGARNYRRQAHQVPDISKPKVCALLPTGNPRRKAKSRSNKSKSSGLRRTADRRSYAVRRNQAPTSEPNGLLIHCRQALTRRQAPLSQTNKPSSQPCSGSPFCPDR